MVKQVGHLGPWPVHLFYVFLVDTYKLSELDRTFTLMLTHDMLTSTVDLTTVHGFVLSFTVVAKEDPLSDLESFKS